MESATVEDPMVRALLAVYISQVGNHTPLMAESVTHFRTWLANTLRSLGVGHFGFKPYSIRRGSTKHDFIVHKVSPGRS